MPHEAEGQLLVTSGSVELSFTDIEGEGVGVFVVWDLKSPSSLQAGSNILLIL